MPKTIKYLDSKLVGILRTKPGTPYENAVSAIKIAYENGLDTCEITSNSKDWQKILKACLKENINIGVGSVKNRIIAREAISLGAKFLVSPGLFDDVVDESKQFNVPLIPGVYLVSEALKAKYLGIPDQKFFPAYVKTDEELFKAIMEPFRDEFEELKNNNCEISFFNPKEGNYNLLDEHEVINSPTEFYNLYLLKDKLKNLKIIIKLPQGTHGFERIKEVMDVEGKIRTYAVGGVNESNLKEVIDKHKYYGVCVGSGIFDSSAVYSGDFNKIKENVIRYLGLFN